MAGKLQGRSSGRNGRRRAHGPMSEINVTPFVDVMLVLLVVFMITAPLLTAGIKVDLPKVSNKAVSKQDNAPVEISMTKKGTIYLGKKKVTVAQLSALLIAIAAERNDQRVYIRADQSLDYGFVMSVMSAVNRSGLNRVALISDLTSRHK